MGEKTPMDNRTLLRRTLVAAGVMVGSWVLFVGTLSLVASVIVHQAVASGDEAAESPAASAPPGALSASPAGAKPPAGLHPTSRK